MVQLVEELRLTRQCRLERARPLIDLGFQLAFRAGEFLGELLRPEVGGLPLSDIHLRGEEIGHAPGRVPHGRNEQGVPEGRPVLAVIEDLYVQILLLCNARMKPRPISGSGFRALQEAAVAAQDLVRAKARQLGKGVVGEDDRIVVLGGVGDEHRHPGGFDSRRERIARLCVITLQAPPRSLRTRLRY